MTMTERSDELDEDFAEQMRERDREEHESSHDADNPAPDCWLCRRALRRQKRRAFDLFY